MLPDIRLAISLQNLDDRAAVLNKEIATLPKHIAEIEQKLDSHNRRLEADKAALAANQRDRKRLEGEIVSQQQKISKLRDQMMGAKTNDVYRAFQHEIEFCQQEISRTEDRILDLMGEAEALDTNVKAAQISLDAEKKQVAAEKKQAEERTAIDRKEIEKLMAERATVMSQITPAVAAEYERIRKGRAGVAVAEAVNGRCSRCNIILRHQFLQELRKNDQIMHCESCKRILYYNPPQSFDDLVPQSVR
ncbi:MAG: hypothetical protein JWN34_4725 [Bryobacterales bacterium]|nr:hypothetical protein [Bryobacterales bacterium]